MPETSSSQRRQLYKNPDDAKVCGVCAGLADYLDFEVWVIRIITISLLILSKFSAMVILPYFILCFVLDPKPGSKSTKGCFGRDKKNQENFTSQGSQSNQASQEQKSRPYNSSIKDVWKSSKSPQQTLEGVEAHFSKMEKKLQGMESYVTSKEYELEKEFKDIEEA